MVDLSGLKVGTAWRVETSIGEGVLLVSDDKHRPYVCYSFKGPPTTIHFKADGWESLDGWCVTRILHELKPVADITASDLDGRVIETEDGGKVLFADGHARMETADECLLGTWGGNEPPTWAHGRKLGDEVAAYAAELERRRNPPVEIVWQGECRDDDGTLLSAWCEVRGEKWRMSRYENGTYGLHCGKKLEGHLLPIGECEARIRERYKDRATST